MEVQYVGQAGRQAGKCRTLWPRALFCMRFSVYLFPNPRICQDESKVCAPRSTLITPSYNGPLGPPPPNRHHITIIHGWRPSKEG
jgi:hypothetical protein